MAKKMPAATKAGKKGGKKAGKGAKVVEKKVAAVPTRKSTRNVGPKTTTQGDPEDPIPLDDDIQSESELPEDDTAPQAARPLSNGKVLRRTDAEKQADVDAARIAEAAQPRKKSQRPT